MEPKRNQGIPKTERQAAGCVTATLTSVCTRPRRPSRRRRRAVARGRLVGKSEMHTQTPQAGPPTCHGPGSLQASKGICAPIGQKVTPEIWVDQAQLSQSKRPTPARLLNRNCRNRVVQSLIRPSRTPAGFPTAHLCVRLRPQLLPGVCVVCHLWELYPEI